MSRTHRSLTKLTLPPELAANITTFVNQSAGGATFVGGGYTSGSRGFQDSMAGTSGFGENLILLSTQDDGLQIFFDPQTREFFTITAELELEEEDGAEDKTLLDSASRLAHSRFGGHDCLPTHPSISTAGNQRRTRSRVHFDRRQKFSEGDMGSRTRQSTLPSDSPEDRGVGGSPEPPRRTGSRQHQGGQDNWATADDIRNLAESITRGCEKIISAIQSNSHGGSRGVTSHGGVANGSQLGQQGPFDQIRRHIDLLTPSARAQQNTVLPADLQAFDPDRDQCCTRENFRVNLEGTPCDDWNKSATQVFVNDFLATHTEYPANIRVVRLMVQKKSTAAIKSLIKGYRRRDMGSPQLEAHQKKMSRHERKRSLYKRRHDVTFYYPGLASQREKLEQLGIAGMSSDETSDGNNSKSFRILTPQWRSPLVAAWVRYFDVLYNRARRDRVFGNGRGAFPRDRKSARGESKSKKFVAGLPINAYRQEWLDKQIDVDNVVQPGPSVPWLHEPAIIELVIGSQTRRADANPEDDMSG